MTILGWIVFGEQKVFNPFGCIDNKEGGEI
jgi:hypothetical protein